MRNRLKGHYTNNRNAHYLSFQYSYLFNRYANVPIRRYLIIVNLNVPLLWRGGICEDQKSVMAFIQQGSAKQEKNCLLVKHMNILNVMFTKCYAR